MELNQIFRLLRKWLWLFFLAGFVAGGVAFVARSNEPPMYRSRVMLSVGNVTQESNPQPNDIYIGQRLAQTYINLVTTFDVLQGTVDALNLPISPDGLRGTISTDIIDGTQLFTLQVRYPDNVLAADIANELARQLILISPTNLTAEQEATLQLSQENVRGLTEQLNDLTEQLSSVNTQLADPTLALSEIDRAELIQRRDSLVTQMTQVRATVATFTQTISDLQRQNNRIEIIEEARISNTPINTNASSVVLTGAAVGVALALAVVVLIEYLDDTIRSSEQAAQLLNLPVLGAIARFGKNKEGHRSKLITNHSLISPIPEGYRVLRTNLLLASDSTRKNVFIVTSPGPEEGKSLTTANLAVSMAWAGLRVLLVDADLRRPRAHEVFGLDNDIGLTTLLSVPLSSNNPNFREELRERLKQCIKETDIPKLKVITSGFPPKNPSEILGSALMKMWVDAFRQSNDIDVVLIDTPPCLVVSDSLALASATNAEVVLVIQARGTRRAAALKARENFEQIGAQIKGVVLNAVDPRDEQGYYYTEYTYYTDDRPAPRGLARLLRRGSTPAQ